MSTGNPDETQNAAAPQNARGGRAPWILSGPADVVLILGTPAICLALLLPLAAAFGSQPVWLVTMTFGSVGHHLPGFLRTYGSAELMARHRFRLMLAPPLVFTAAFVFAAHSLHGMLLVSLVWSVWHGMMQHYGFMRVYDAKVGVHAPEIARLDWTLTCAWFATCLLWSPTQSASVLAAILEVGHAPLPHAALRAVGNASAVVTLVVGAIYAIAVVRWRRRGIRVSGQKLALLATSGAYVFFVRVLTTDPFLSVALFEVLHDVQYLAIVWAFNRRLPATRLDRWLFRPSVARVLFYVALCAAYGSLALAAEQWIDEGLTRRLLVAGLATSGILHFYYDGFIWKVRQPEVRAGLGITGAAASGLQPAAGERRRTAIHGAGFVGIVLALATVELALPRAPEAVVAATMVELVPESSVAHHNLGVALLADGRAHEAVEHLRVAAEIRPGFAEGQRALGEALLAAGAAGEAATAFARAIALAPDDLAARGHLARAHLASGAINDAIHVYEEVLARDEALPSAHANLGLVLARHGQPARGVAHLERALELDPASVGTRVNLGLVLDALGRHADALAQLREAVRLDPTSVPALANLGGVALKLGRRDEAAASLRRALELDPSFTPARHNLALLNQRAAPTRP